ncbi:MAG: TatD family hydrolase [Chloroflexi bacterium]|nr:TatD family hydrolase [Chloroflexota bacterium]
MAALLADSHSHLDQFADAEVDAMVQRAREAGVGMIVCVGTTLVSSRKVIELARRHDVIYAGVGVHPQDVKAPVTDADLVALRALATSDAKVVCISETGLDYQETSPDRGWQQEWFRRHIRLARELGKPIDFHSREADADTLRIIREERVGDVGAIWHYFQGTQADAETGLALGCYISLAKPLLRTPELEAVVRTLPLERIVLETDTYPQPFKKNPVRRTEPSHVRLVAEKVAELRGMTVEEVAEVTTANLRRALRMG